MSIPAKKADDITAASIEAVLIKGDLSKLTEEQRLEYYNSVCKMVGLNPLTRLFDYLFLQGKLSLYPNKSCAEQLRKIHDISLEIVSQDLSSDGLYTVHARAKDNTGRTDEDVGVVTFGQLPRRCRRQHDPQMCDQGQAPGHAFNLRAGVSRQRR